MKTLAIFSIHMGWLLTACASPQPQRGQVPGSQQLQRDKPCTPSIKYNFLSGAASRFDPVSRQGIYMNMELILNVSKECGKFITPLERISNISQSKGWRSNISIWIESADNKNLVVYLWTDHIPEYALKVLNLATLPILNGEIKYISGSEGGVGNPLFVEGMTIWGATQSQIVINGKPRCNMKGAKVINGDIDPQFLCIK
jgi:hypothetical protein